MTWSNATSLKVQFFHPLRFPLAWLLLSARCFLGRYPSLSTPTLPVTQRGIEDSPGHWAGSSCFTRYKRLRVAHFQGHYSLTWQRFLIDRYLSCPLCSPFCRCNLFLPDYISLPTPWVTMIQA